MRKAKFVEFTTLYDPKQMPGQRAACWTGPTSKACGSTRPMHPLALLCFGLYGEDLPNQDGAPLRLVVPWKYGFKSIKSIVKITLHGYAAGDHLEQSQRRMSMVFIPT